MWLGYVALTGPSLPGTNKLDPDAALSWSARLLNKLYAFGCVYTILSSSIAPASRCLSLVCVQHFVVYVWIAFVVAFG